MRAGRWPLPKISPPPSLSPKDWADLQASGLTRDTVRENGVETVSNAGELARRLNRGGLPWEYPEFCRDGGMVFPYRDLAGDVNCYCRAKPHSPRKDKDGKPVKYESPQGQRSRPYFPAASLPLLRGGASPVHLIEGEKKALCVSQLGLAAVGLGGVWNWKVEGTDDLLPELAAVPWAGRAAYVVFDYDEKLSTRRNNAQSARRLAAALKKAGAAVVHVVELPPGTDGGKQGADDFIVAKGAAAYHTLVSVSVSVPYREKTETETEFPGLVLASELRAADADEKALLAGCLAPAMVTLFVGLWKAGKTTFLSLLLKAMEGGGEFCGLPVQPSRVLYVTEESERHWAPRRDRLGLGDHVAFLVRPFLCKPTIGKWLGFLSHVIAKAEEHAADLVVFDTLSNLWPVRNENDQGEVQEALMPLHALTARGLSVLLAHHPRKGDGKEATAARGSGALTAFADTILELRRHRPADKADRCRVLTGYSRLDGVPQDLVIELTSDGTVYEARGGKQEFTSKSLRELIAGVLPKESPGASPEDLLMKFILKAAGVKLPALKAELKRGVEDGAWKRDGKGTRGSPFTYWAA
jgi:hypothetical protein